LLFSFYNNRKRNQTEKDYESNEAFSMGKVKILRYRVNWFAYLSKLYGGYYGRKRKDHRDPDWYFFD